MSAWEATTNDGWAHEQPCSCDKCDTDKGFKDVLNIDIQEKNVGWFSGKDGSKIKNYVIDKTFKEVGGDTELYCEVETKEGEVFARIKAQDAKGLEALRENVRRHEEIFKEKEKQTRIMFRTRLDHNKIGTMIGSHGSNIERLRNQIKRDCILFHDNVYVKIEKYNVEGKEKDYIPALGRDFSDEEETVIISIDLFTENHEETMLAISTIMWSEVKRLMEGVNDLWDF